MLNLTRLSRHASLVDRMAETLGVDLGESVQRGALNPEELRAAVVSCTGCVDPDGCEAFLADANGAADAPPGFCRNAALLRDLAPKP